MSDRVKPVEDWMYIDESGYEKHLSDISHYSLDHVRERLTVADYDASKRIVYIQIRGTSGQELKAAASSARKIVYENLGMPKDSRYFCGDRTVFLATVGRQRSMIGFVEAEPLPSAYQYEIDPEYKTDPLPCIGTDPVPVKCGIIALWVKPNYRNRKIATRLLQLVRAKMFPDEELEWRDIAFAHINLDGKRFVSHFFNKQTSSEREVRSQSDASGSADVDELQSDVDEPQSGVDEPQSGVNEPQSGVNKSQSGVDEPQPGVDEPQSGVDEPQSGVDEPQSEE